MNLGTLLRKAAMTFPANTALSYGESDTTYSELNLRVNGLANSLVSLGVRRGDSVVIMQYNCPQLIETLFACFKVGTVAVPVNARLHSSEFSYIIGNSDASVVVFGEDFKQVIQAMSRGNDLSGKQLICLTNPSNGMIDYEKQMAQGANAEPTAEAAPDDVAWLFYTSGTTGRPKGAMLTHRNLMAMTMNFMADLYNPSEHDIALHAAPLTHGSGLYILPLLARGATNIILKPKSLDPQLVFETIEHRRVSIIPFLTPTMIKMLLISPELGNHDLSGLRCVIYGGSPMYEQDLEQAIKRFGRIFVQVYGQGEAPMTIAYLRSDQHTVQGDEKQAKRRQSAGIARTDVEVKIFDDYEREVANHTLGEIVVRGDVVMKGYWKDPKATSETLRYGWLHTGDIGYMDENGYIYIMDRKKDMIISGGSNIYPREVEEIILKHPAVLEVAVVGVPDQIWGESVKAVIVLKPGIAAMEKEIVDFCKDHMASYKKPKSVDFVDSIPKSAYGKILKREIREKYWQNMIRKI